MKKSYTAAFKAHVVLELLKDTKTLAELSSEHGVHANVLRDSLPYRKHVRKAGGVKQVRAARDRIAFEVRYQRPYLADYQSPRDARHGIARSMTFYNTERPHQALDYRRPAELYLA